MTLFQLIIVVMGFVFLLFAVDLYQRKKFNLLHFLVFFGGTALIVLFGIRQDLLDQFGAFFGVARGADLIVYISIIFLFFLFFEQLNMRTKQESTITNLVTQNSCQRVDYFQWDKDTQLDNFCFLVRAYNENTVIASVIETIIDAGYSKIVVCDDGSQDDTQSTMMRLQKKHKYIIYLKHLINRGPGAANKTLFEFVRQRTLHINADWYVTFDADGQMDIHDMEKFMDAVKNKEWKVLLGSRFIKGGKAKNISFVRRIILRGAKFVTLFFNKIYVTDPTNGYKVIHKDALKKISIQADGFMYASEFLEEITRNNLSRTEVPVRIIYTDYSKEKGQQSSNAFKILRNLIYKTFFYK